MSGAPSSPGDVFDVKRIRRLVELMKEHDLSEIDLREADTRIRLRRAGDEVVPLVQRPATAAPLPVATPLPSAQAAAATPASETAAEGQVTLIKSPMVGTFYTSANPETPAFVKVGDHVGPESTVCIIEAMKVFNEIPAEVSGKIVAVLVENAEPVEYGQPLFKVDVGK
jgi:acetyl-CoA carboxylase biotin carboxyl carrier protein